MVLCTFLTIRGLAHLNISSTIADKLLQEIDILSDVWMYDVDSREKLETIITEIFSYIKNYKIEIPEESCLVLEFRPENRCGYYFVNHAEQRLFWLDEYNGMDFKVEYTPLLIGESYILLHE